MVSFFYAGANVCELAKFCWIVGMYMKFVGNWFIAIQSKMIHYFVLGLWGINRL